MALELALTQTPPATATTDCVIVGLFSDPLPDGHDFTPSGRALDIACGGQLGTLAGRGDISAASGKTTLLHALPGISAARVLVVDEGRRSSGVGEGITTTIVEAGLGDKPLRRIVGADTFTPLAGAAFLVLPSEAEIVAMAAELA